MSKYDVIFGPYFPVLGLNTEIYSINLQIQSKHSKIQTRNNSVFGHFSRSRKNSFPYKVRNLRIKALSKVWDLKAVY